MVKRAVEMEGTVTGEHGVGLIKRDYLEHELGIDAVDAMRKVSFPLNLSANQCSHVTISTAQAGIRSHVSPQLR